MKRITLMTVVISSSIIILTLGCNQDNDLSNTLAGDNNMDLAELIGLETLGPIPYPPDNQPRQERISLGRLLFFDPILGGERDISCGTCHHPDFAFADLRQFGAGVSGNGLGPDRILSTSKCPLSPSKSYVLSPIDICP